jgi:uncharacterized PurR-regulated membrane protein YhhQ (DUF165 family)
VNILKGIFKGFFYAILMIFFSRLINAFILLISNIPANPDPYYDVVLINGISFLGTWGSLIVFTIYLLEDFILSLIYGYKKVENAIKSTEAKN